ncbi:MAG TPA: anion permease [Prosthecobacter sp.]|nr:anion permease [Prosthecobacter sp.]
MLFFILIAVAIVAYANGANGNFKGVASLYGSGTTRYRVAVNWAAVTTAAGSVAAMMMGAALLKAFSGKGLVPDALIAQPVFLFAVAAGAGLAGFFATRLGFPVSTTHMLTGGLLGAGVMADPAGVNLGKLWDTFARPLLLSPVIAVGAGGVIYLLLKALRLAPDHRTRTLDALHFLSAGAVCFARGLNDTPKMAALLLGVGWMQGSAGTLMVAAAMTAGGLISARQVAETLSHKITDMNPGQGFAANVATSLLATTASYHGLPVSTTHISVGALLGIGITTRQAKWRTVVPVLAAWVLTLPFAMVLSAMVYGVSRRFLGVATVDASVAAKVIFFSS